MKDIEKGYNFEKINDSKLNTADAGKRFAAYWIDGIIIGILIN